MSTLAEVKAFQKRERAKHKAGRVDLSEKARSMRLSRILITINNYSRKCAKAEYTDPGEAWEVFDLIRDIAKGKV